MSEIPRYELTRTETGFINGSIRNQNGEYCLYNDLLCERRQRRMAYVINVIVVLICAVLAGYLVYHKHAPQPVAKVSAEETAKKTELLNNLKASHERAVANVEMANKVYHSSAKDLERIKGLLEINANLKAQIKAQNQLLNPIQQTETLKVAATKMHDGQVAQLAREVGFTKVRITNE